MTQAKPILPSINSKKFSEDPALEKVSSIEELISLSSRKKEIHLK